MNTTSEATSSETPNDGFDALPLTAEVRRAIDEIGWVSPTPVQVATYGPAAAGRDLIVQSRTGTGKTAAFGIPLCDRVVRAEPGVQALVLAPTRELALQSARELEKIGKHRGIATVAVYGGAPMERQVRELQRGAQIVSGTPGRVLDHLRRGTLKPAGIRALVLDEADEMLSMGFAKELNAILEMLPAERQTLLFSATVGTDVQRIAQRMKEPELLLLSGDVIGAVGIAHFAYMVSGKGRPRDLIRILEVENPESAIIFCNTKAETERVAAELQQAGFNADWLNGDLPQSEREKVMARTRKGELRYLVATDVAARGIDVSHLTHVINFSMPEQTEQYIHRTGRTGRAGRTGTAISLVGPQDLGTLYYLRLQYRIFPIERSIPTAGEERTRAEADRVSLLEEAFRGKPGDMDLSVARRLLTHPDAERLLAGLLRTFFGGKGDDVDEQAAAARRARSPEPAAAEPERDEPSREQRRRRSRRDDVPDASPPRREEAPPERFDVFERLEADDVAEPAEAEGAPEERRPRRRRRRGRSEGPATDLPRADRPEGGQAAGAEPPDDEPPDAGEAGDDDADAGPAAENMAMLYLNVGRRDGLRPAEVSRLLREQAGLGRADIGRIRIRDRHTFVGVPRDRVDEVMASLAGQSLHDRELVVEPAKNGQS